MIVDLLRNDLGRIAQTGSVKVPELFAVEPYSTVFQMTSTVQAQLRPEIGFADLLRAVFPCGSITGIVIPAHTRPPVSTSMRIGTNKSTSNAASMLVAPATSRFPVPRVAANTVVVPRNNVKSDSTRSRVHCANR